jgi:hypothetical protein
MPAHHICSYVATRQEIRATCGDPARRTAGRSSTSDREAVHGGGERYEIRLEGHLDGRWSAWFDGLRLTNEADGTATLSGTVIDQSALHGCQWRPVVERLLATQPARRRRGHLLVDHRSIPAGLVRPAARHQPLAVPNHRVRGVDDRRLPTLPTLSRVGRTHPPRDGATGRYDRPRGGGSAVTARSSSSTASRRRGTAVL